MAPPKLTAPINLYPPPPPLDFAADGKLQGAVATALTELNAARGAAQKFSLAIVDLGGGGSRGTLKFGAFKPDEEHYVASAAKVAAMYAAFALRDMARRFASMSAIARITEETLAAINAATAGRAPPKRPKPPTLFDQLRAVIDPVIDATAPAPLFAAVKRAHRVPHYEHIFLNAAAGMPTDFRGDFKRSMHQMIVPSSNPGAGQVIRAVGYGYLNGALAAARLFDDKNRSGVWLAGDFVGLYPYARIQSANDGLVAQAGSALAMAKMMSLIVNEAAVDSGASKQMKELLVEAVTGVDTPFLTRDGVSEKLRIPLEKITHCKLGFGPLKAGGEVCSEIFRLEGLRSASKAYAVAYQNVPNFFASLSDMAFMIRRSIEIYET